MTDTILEFLQKGPAHLPLKDILRNVDPELRHRRMDSRTKSIWEEVEHMRLAQQDILNYMIDAQWKSPDWSEGYWPESKAELSDAEWQATINGFNQDLDTLCTLVSDIKDKIVQPIPHAPQHTFLREILLVIDHNAFHSGKIVLIRKHFKNWPG